MDIEKIKEVLKMYHASINDIDGEYIYIKNKYNKGSWHYYAEIQLDIVSVEVYKRR